MEKSLGWCRMWMRVYPVVALICLGAALVWHVPLAAYIGLGMAVLLIPASFGP